MPQLLIQIAIFALPIMMGFIVGSLVERAHFRRLKKRESKLAHMLVTDIKTYPKDTTATLGLVTGEVVIASDYFKTFATSLKKLVGGELYAFESLMERARREATVRMLDAADRMGAGAVINIRFSSSNIGNMKRKQAAAMVEIYAYGTAVQLQNPSTG